MPSVAVRLDYAVLAGKAVHHAVVLDVAAGLEEQPAEVAAQAGARTDIAPPPDDDVADQHRSRMHERARIDYRAQAIDGVDVGHLLPPFPLPVPGAHPYCRCRIDFDFAAT